MVKYFDNFILDEFGKIALEKGWIKNADTIPPWQDLPKSYSKNIPPYLTDEQMKEWVNKQQKSEIETKQAPQEQPRQSPQLTNLINSVQWVLKNATKMPVSNPKGRYQGNPDGIWGSRSAAAWNQYLEMNPVLAQYISKADPSGKIIPKVVELKFFIDEWVPYIERVKKELHSKKPIESFKADDKINFKEAEMPFSPQQKKIIESLMTLKGLSFDEALQVAKQKYNDLFGEPAQTMDRKLPESNLKGIEEEMKKQYPELNDDGIINAKKTVKELVSLANDLENMGEAKAAFIIDEQLKIYKSAMDKLYDVTGETGEDLINQAHPGGGPTLFQAKEEGGKVETIVEEHRRNVEKSQKAPTGKQAELINKLVATANKLEEKKEFKAAANVDKTIAELWKSFPFVSRSLVSEATNSEDNKASIKTVAKKFGKLVPAWDNIINNYYNPIKKEISSFLIQQFAPITGTIDYFTINKMRERFRDAEIQKNRIIDSWNFADPKTMANLVNNFAESLDLGNNTFSTMEKLFVGSAKEHRFANLYDNMVKKIYQLSKLFLRYDEKVPIKKEKKLTFEQEYKQKYLNNVKATADKIIKLLYDKPQAAKSFLGNIKNVQQLINELNSLKVKADNIQDPDKLFNLSKNLWDRVYVKLRNKLANKENILMKKSESILERLMQEEKPKEKPVPKKAPRGYRKGDPDIIRLQTALSAAGFSPGKIDGIWGPKTAAAYNSFIEKMNLQNYLRPIENVRRQRSVDKQKINLNKAVNLAEYVSKRKTGLNEIKPKYFPRSISLDHLNNVDSFINYLKYTFGAKQITPQAAMDYLREIGDYIDRNEIQMTAKDPGSVARWKSNIDSLFRKLQSYKLEKPELVRVKSKTPTETKKAPEDVKKGIEGIEGIETISSPQDFANALRRLPDANGLMSPMRFQDSAEIKGLSARQYFNNLRDTIANLYNYWENNFRFQNVKKSYINGAKEMLLRYTGILRYIAENKEEFFGPKRQPVELPEKGPRYEHEAQRPESYKGY